MSEQTIAHHAQGLAAGGPGRARRVRDLRRARREPRHVVPRDARHRQRAPDPRRQGTHRLRPRLPRGHLRFVRDDDQRAGPRPAARHRDVSAAHAEVLRRRPHHDRTVARGGLPDRARPDRRPQPVRRASSSPAATSAPAPAAHPTATSSRSRSRSPTRRWTRRRASAAVRASPRARTAPRSCSRRRSCSTSTCCRRVRPNAGTARSRWSRRWSRTSARARTTASAKPRARSRSPSTSSR